METDWYTITPVVPAEFTLGYFDLPIFALAAPAWKGASEIARQYNYTASKNFALRRRPTKPVGVNYGLCIRYRVGDVVTRYKLWNDEGFVLPNVDLYNGQVIKKNFCLEIWTLDGEANVSQASIIRLGTGIRRRYSDFTAMPATYEDNAGVAVASLESGAAPGAPVLEGLEAWYLADDDNVTVDGLGNVEEWRDLSGNDRHLVQAIAGSRPAISANGFGSRNQPCIVFDGVDDSLYSENPLPVSFPIGHLYLAMFQRAWVNGRVIFTTDQVTIWQTGGANFLTSVRDGISVAVGFPISASGADEDTPRVVEHYDTSDPNSIGYSHTLAENSLFGLVEANTAVVPGELFHSTFMEFSSIAAGASFTIAEALLYSSKRSGEQDALIKQYLANRYTVSMALPLSFDSGSAWLDNPPPI